MKKTKAFSKVAAYTAAFVAVALALVIGPGIGYTIGWNIADSISPPSSDTSSIPGVVMPLDIDPAVAKFTLPDGTIMYVNKDCYKGHEGDKNFGK